MGASACCTCSSPSTSCSCFGWGTRRLVLKVTFLAGSSDLWHLSCWKGAWTGKPGHGLLSCSLVSAGRRNLKRHRSISHSCCRWGQWTTLKLTEGEVSGHKVISEGQPGCSQAAYDIIEQGGEMLGPLLNEQRGTSWL